MSNRRNRTNSNNENEGNGLGNLPSFAPPPPAMGRSGSSMMPPPPPAMGRSGSSMMPPPPSFGYGRYHNTRSEANIKAEQARTQKATEELLAKLPDPTQAISMVLSLQYFVILLDETRIPIESLFRYVSEHPETSVFRSFDDRIIIIVEAIQPNGEVYWRQAMYCSTGTSSGMRYTWFPFNGIFVKKEGYAQTKPYRLSLWFEKEYFNPSEADERGFRKIIRFDPPKTPYQAVSHVYSGIGLPEGNYIYYTESPEDQAEFDRFGSLSYFVASYKLGSKFFTNMVDTKLYPSQNNGPFSFASYHPDKDRYENILYFLTNKKYKDIDVLRSLVETPNEIDYAALVKSIPIAKPNRINDMIDRLQASSIYNYFRNRPIRIPPYSAYSVFLPTLGYALPKADVFSMFHRSINYTFLNSIENNLSDEEIQTQINKDFAYALEFNDFETLKNDYNISTIYPKNANYFGGARAQTRRRKARAQTRRRKARRCRCGL
jgi:hypothetical protein